MSTANAGSADILDELEWRGLIAQTTDRDALRRELAAGVLTLEDGVRFAARRAELTQAAADAHPGKMAALLGATPEQAEDACTAAPDACWLANDNAPGQVVISTGFDFPTWSPIWYPPSTVQFVGPVGNPGRYADVVIVLDNSTTSGAGAFPAGGISFPLGGITDVTLTADYRRFDGVDLVR